MNNKNLKTPQDKVELAKKIASHSRKVTDSYMSFEEKIFRIFKWFSNLIDNILFNKKYSVLVALGIAVLLYFNVNYNSENSIFSRRLNSAKTLSKIPIHVKYNAEAFEVVGIPEECEVTLLGDASSVNNAATKKGRCSIDLDGYVEGVYIVKLSALGYGDNVNLKIVPSDATVTLKKKTTGQFIIGYDFINTDKLDPKFSLNPPVFENNKVNIRASQDTLNSIAFVKALIDVSGVENNFTKEANLVAYNKQGLPVQADIVPNKVTVNVKVSSPQKTVPIVLETTGKLPDNLAIESVFLDHQTVTIFAPEAVLAGINHVTLKVDVSQINKDTKLVQPLVLPNNASSSNVSKVSLDIKLGEAVSKEISNVPILFQNYNNDYQISVENNQVSVPVKIYGTKNNIDEVKASDLSVYFDLKDLKAGKYNLPLQISSSPNPFVTIETSQKTISVTLSADKSKEE